jgi:hypothetical protein
MLAIGEEVEDPPEVDQRDVAASGELEENLVQAP